MTRISIKAAVLAAAALLLVGSHASAAPTFFFGEDQSASGTTVAGAPVIARNAFLAGVAGGVSSEGFETFTEGNSPSSLAFSGSSGTLTAAFSGSGVSTIYASGSFGLFNTTPGGTNYLRVQGPFTLDFGSTGVSAFGLYGSDVGDFNGQLTVTLTDTGGTDTTYNVNHTWPEGADGALLFWGFIDSGAAYTRISFANTGNSGDVFGFDDMVVADAQHLSGSIAAAEPGTLALLGLGLAVLAGSRRREHSR